MAKKARIKLPAGSMGIFKSDRNSGQEKVILPPGKLRVSGQDPDGTPVLEVVEQDGFDKVMRDMERRTQKASSTMTGDQRREAGLLIDAIQKARKENKQTSGKSDKRSSNYTEIIKRNRQITEAISSAGGSLFDHFSSKKSMMNELEKIDARYGTNYAMGLDEAYADFTDAIRLVLDDIRMPSNAVREEDESVSKYLKRAIEKKTNDEIIEILSRLAFRLHNGFERLVAVDVSTEMLMMLSERKKIVRDKSSGSQQDVQRDLDLTLGVARPLADEMRPISGWMHHSGYRSQNSKTNAKTFKPQFFSMSDRIQVILKPEVFGRVGYSRSAGIFGNSFTVSATSESMESLMLAIMGNINSRNSKQSNKELLETYLEAAITGDYSQMIGNINSPGYRAYIAGGFAKSEVQFINYPLSMVDLNSVKIKPRDPVLGKDIIALRLKKLKMSDADAIAFMNSGGPIGGGLMTPSVTVYLQQKAADAIKVELSPLNISDIRFVNPEGLDIFDPYSFQDQSTRLLESGSRIVADRAIREIDEQLPEAVKKFLKEKERKK